MRRRPTVFVGLLFIGSLLIGIKNILLPYERRTSQSSNGNLYGKVRIFCFILTFPENLATRASAVRDTWARRFDEYVFITSRRNSSFPTVGVDVPEGRRHLTAKSLKGFQYAYDHFFDKADWFMKADDDTYVIVENLRNLLSRFDPNEPLLFGFLLKLNNSKREHVSGGAGYILSKEALRRLVLRAIPNRAICRRDGGSEDQQVTYCLYNVGVNVVNTRDSDGLHRFHMLSPRMHFKGIFPHWMRDREKGYQSSSNFTISYHYVKPREMYMLHFLIYHLHLGSSPPDGQNQ